MTNLDKLLDYLEENNTTELNQFDLCDLTIRDLPLCTDYKKSALLIVFDESDVDHYLKDVLKYTINDWRSQLIFLSSIIALLFPLTLIYSIENEMAPMSIFIALLFGSLTWFYINLWKEHIQSAKRFKENSKA